MIFLIAAQASAEPGVTLSCKATHSVGSEGAVCGSEKPEEGADIYVGFGLSTVSGRGNLCTYTYCRDFVLVPLPGDSLDEALKKLSGFTLSEKRGSTGDDLERPAIDYQLSRGHIRAIGHGCECAHFIITVARAINQYAFYAPFLRCDVVYDEWLSRRVTSPGHII